MGLAAKKVRVKKRKDRNKKREWRKPSRAARSAQRLLNNLAGWLDQDQDVLLALVAGELERHARKALKAALRSC